MSGSVRPICVFVFVKDRTFLRLGSPTIGLPFCVYCFVGAPVLSNSAEMDRTSDSDDDFSLILSFLLFSASSRAFLLFVLVALEAFDEGFDT